MSGEEFRQASRSLNVFISLEVFLKNFAIIMVTSPKSLTYSFLFKVIGTFLKPRYHPVSHLEPQTLCIVPSFCRVTMSDRATLQYHTLPAGVTV